MPDDVPAIYLEKPGLSTSQVPMVVFIIRRLVKRLECGKQGLDKR